MSITNTPALDRETLNRFKDDLLIVLVARLAQPGHTVSIPAGEIDNVGGKRLEVEVDQVERVFHLKLLDKPQPPR